MQNKLLLPVVAGIVAIIFVAAAVSHQPNNVSQQDSEYSAQTQSAEDVSAESSGNDFYNSDEYLYSPNSGLCRSAVSNGAIAYEQERSPSRRTLATLKKCEYYARLAAEESRRNPPKHGALYRSDD